MLLECSRNDFEKYTDFAFELALDPSKSGYPTYRDGIKTKAMFVERLLKAFDPCLQLLRIHAGRQDQKLISPGAEHIRLWKCAVKDRSCVFQQHVARRVPLFIVDPLQPVQVCEDHGAGRFQPQL